MFTAGNEHGFEILKRGTDEVVDYSEIATPDGDLKIRINVGHDENPPQFRAKTLNAFPYPVYLDGVRDQDEVHTREFAGE